MNIDDRLTTDQRLTTDRPQGQFTHFGKISNGHISGTRQPIPFMFGSRVEFSGTADPTAPFPVGSNSRWRPAVILEYFKRAYLSNKKQILRNSQQNNTRGVHIRLVTI